MLSNLCRNDNSALDGFSSKQLSVSSNKASMRRLRSISNKPTVWSPIEFKATNFTLPVCGSSRNRFYCVSELIWRLS